MNLIKLTNRLTLIATSISLVGCFSGPGFNIKPTDEPYAFVYAEPTLQNTVSDIYPGYSERREENIANGTETFSAMVRSPADNVICFAGNETGYALPIKDETGEETPLKFVNGMYPFSLHDLTVDDGQVQTLADCGEIGTPNYVGAMAFFAYEQDMEFATFGADYETALISEEIIDKVSDGILGSHTISYDDRPRIKYWVGNRSTLYSGGAPTVEVDFRNANIKKLKINGEEVANLQAELAIYEEPEDGGRTRKKQYKLEFETYEGGKFGGYLKELIDNEYTAYMKIPCDIPEELFEAASKGTVSKFDVMSKSEESAEGTRIAQIVFGRRR